MSLFVPNTSEDVTTLIADQPLAWVVCPNGDGFHATPLPLLAEEGEDGTITSFLGHFALRNPQVAALRENPRALVLFQGAQGYVSPLLVSQEQWAPTWNYQVARFTVDVAFVPEENDAAIDRLVSHMEGQGGWTAAQMGERYAKLAAHIVAFRARIVARDVTFKLGQDERPETLAEILAGHTDAALVAAMREANRR